MGLRSVDGSLSYLFSQTVKVNFSLLALQLERNSGTTKNSRWLGFPIIQYYNICVFTCSCHPLFGSLRSHLASVCTQTTIAFSFEDNVLCILSYLFKVHKHTLFTLTCTPIVLTTCHKRSSRFISFPSLDNILSTLAGMPQRIIPLEQSQARALLVKLLPAKEFRYPSVHWNNRLARTIAMSFSYYRVLIYTSHVYWRTIESNSN